MLIVNLPTQVREAIGSSDFKPNCAMVALDFLIRHSYIQPDQGRRPQCQLCMVKVKKMNSGKRDGGENDKERLLCRSTMHTEFSSASLFSEPHYVELVEGLHQSLWKAKGCLLRWEFSLYFLFAQAKTSMSDGNPEDWDYKILVRATIRYNLCTCMWKSCKLKEFTVPHIYT